jgi:hypothetical protein
MVRIKHRYLLVNILYPSSQATQLKVANNNLPDVVQFHQPTSSEFNDEMLRRLIRNNVSELFGDYGIGMIAGSLKGTLQAFSCVLQQDRLPFAQPYDFKSYRMLTDFKSCTYPQQLQQQSFECRENAIGLFGVRYRLRRSCPNH